VETKPGAKYPEPKKEVILPEKQQTEFKGVETKPAAKYPEPRIEVITTTKSTDSKEDKISPSIPSELAKEPKSVSNVETEKRQGYNASSLHYH
jgi:hypothetical protein